MQIVLFQSVRVNPQVTSGRALVLRKYPAAIITEKFAVWSIVYANFLTLFESILPLVQIQRWISVHDDEGFQEQLEEIETILKKHNIPCPDKSLLKRFEYERGKPVDRNEKEPGWGDFENTEYLSIILNKTK